jgi:tetratricopeptide (TPR) repeat protein
VLKQELKVKFEKAIKLGKSRKYKEASILLYEITREASDFPEAYLFLGRSYHGLNRMEEAVHILRHYLNLVPESATGNFFLGRSLLSLGYAKNSITYLKKAVISHPGSVHANGFLGIAYLNSGRSDLAITYLTKAAEKSAPQKGIYKIYLGTLFIRAVSNFKAGDMELAAQMFIFLIESSFDSILPYIYMGMIERHYGNFNSALSYYDSAIEYSPDDKLLLYRRAVLLYKVGNTTGAVEELKKLDIEPEADENIYLAYEYFTEKKYNKSVYYGNLALHSNVGNINLHLLLGEVNRELNKLSIAENHYKKAIKLDRTRLEGRYGLSLVLWLKKDYEQMMVELKKITRSDPGNAISQYYEALCMCKLNYDTNTTIPAVQTEIRANPPDTHLFTALGEEYIKTGLDELAEKWFLKAVKLNPNFKDAYNNLINYYKNIEDTEKLIESYKNYLRITSNSLYSYEFIFLLYKRKNYEETIEEINKILPGLPNNYRLIRILANSYRFTKKWDEAIINYRIVLTHEPDNENILQSIIYCLDHSGKIEQAIKLLNNALVYLKDPSINIRLIKGVLCFKNKNYDEGLKVFRKVLNVRTNDWRIYHNIAMIYQAKGIDDFAEQFFSRAKEYKNK